MTNITLEQFKALALPLAKQATSKRERVATKKHALSQLRQLFDEHKEGMDEAPRTVIADTIAKIGAELEKNRERGVCDLVRELLMDVDNYPTHKSIVREVLKHFPNAETSVKSSASIARDMRKIGIPVPHRNVKAGPAKLTEAGYEAVEALDSLEDLESGEE